ncbi:hypothetical protein [Holdemania filiformis]|uniref:hypothetical protein n=1 Tax=Holdemania filiformis TaxID=61171 RepID=UPI00267094F6|nr:hypothetical protein [Holdemania filiformis]
MKQNNLLLNISDQQLQQAGLTRAQARKSLAALDYRDNDVFRHVMNAENPVSRKILTMYLSDLLHRRIVWIGSEATEPVKANFREKGVRYDVMVRIRDDQGKPMLVNLEMQNYRMAESLSLRSQGYASRMVSDQIEVGGSFDFIPVLQIMITKRMPEMKASSEYLHYHRYTNEKTSKRMPKERCRTLWIEMEKTQALERIPTEQWRISDKITYMLRYSRDPKKQKIIHELIEKEEVIRMMEEKRMDFLKDTSYAIAKMRMKYDEMDEKTVYKKGMRKGVKKGVKQGKISLLKELLRQKWELTESDEKVLDNLNEAKVNQIVQVLNRINTSEDLHEQLKKLSDSKHEAENITQLSYTHD